jgi:hypothetical protein
MLLCGAPPRLTDSGFFGREVIFLLIEIVCTKNGMDCTMTNCSGLTRLFTAM